MYKDRREFLKELLQEKELLGVEIGALDKPLVKREDLSEGSKVLYADHLSTENLKKKYKLDSSVDLNALVDVDLISSDGNYLDSLQGQLVDYVVASHVVEHVPNPILWFQMLFEIIRPGGFIFLVVPDKRFTFDYQRPVTTFGDLLESFLTQKNAPSIADVFDHYSSAVMIDGGKVWSGLLGSTDLIPLTSNEKALEYAKEVYSDNTYHDVHVSIFTPVSFFSIIERLIHAELLYPEVIKFKDTNINDIEFFVCLKKPKVSQNDLKLTCLNSIPDLSLETLVSPYMPQVKSLKESLSKITDLHKSLDDAYSRKEAEVKNQRDEIQFLEKELNSLRRVLNRKGVKFVLHLLDRIFKIVPSLKKFF